MMETHRPRGTSAMTAGSAPEDRTFARPLALTMAVATMSAVLSIGCVGPDEPAPGNAAPPATSALTTTRINDANIPNYCIDSNRCFLANDLNYYFPPTSQQNQLLRVVDVRVHFGTPASLGTCYFDDTESRAYWHMSAADFAARQPLLNTRQAKIAVTCTDGVITSATVEPFPIVLTTPMKGPSSVTLQWSLPNAPATHRYNVYRDGVRVASSLVGKSYVSNTQDGIGHYYWVEVDPASFPGGAPTLSPKIAVMTPSAQESLWMAGSTLYRVDSATGWKGAVNQHLWARISSMTGSAGGLFIVNQDVLHRVNGYTGQVTVLGGPNWSGPTFVTVSAGLFIWRENALWKVDPSTGTFARHGTWDWTGVSAMTSAANYIYVVQNGTLYVYSPEADTKTRLGATGAWSGTSRMVMAWKKLNPDYSVSRLYMLKNGRLWEHDWSSDATVPLGDTVWIENPTLATGPDSDFLYLSERFTFYKVNKQTGVRTAIVTRWPNPTFMVPN